MHTNPQLFRNNTTTTATGLRRVGRDFRDNLASGLDSLVCQQVTEHSQTHVMSRAGQVAVLKHEVETQLFQHDCAVGVYQLPRGFVPPVPALVGDVLLLFPELANGLAPSLTALLAPGNLALKAAQLCQGLLPMFGAVKRLAVAQSQRVRESHVDTYGWAGMFCWLRRWQLNLQTHGPAGRLTQEDDVLQLAIRQFSMPADGEKSSVLHIQLAPLHTGAITGLVTDAVEAGGFLESRVATLALKERAEGAVQAAQDLLTGAHIQLAKRIVIWLLVTPLPPHRCLLVVCDAVTRFLPTLAPKVQCRIVQPAPGLKDIAQGLRLFLCGIETVLVSANHLATLLFLDVPLDSLRGNMPGRSNVIAASPHSRQPAFEPGELLSQDRRRVPLNAVHNLVGRHRGGKAAKQVNVVGLDNEVKNVTLKRRCLFVNKLLEPFRNLIPEHGSPVLRAPNDVVVNVVGCVPCSLAVHKLMIAQLFGNVRQQREILWEPFGQG